MLRTSQQNKILHALLGKCNIDDEQKQELVYQYSQGRTSKSSELTIPECQALINNLNAMHQTTAIKAGEKQRRKIISICHEMGWQLSNGKIDMVRLNTFCENRTYLHKPLNDYTPQELPALVAQFEKILKAYYNAKTSQNKG